MPRKFEIHAPDKAAIFFLKVLLLSFWIGIDVITVLMVSIFSVGGLAQHILLSTIALTVLISGTVFSGLLVWASDSLFARHRTAVEVKWGRIARHLHAVKQRPDMLVGAGVICTSVLVAVFTFFLVRERNEIVAVSRAGHASVETSRKCFEVASLEGRLFQSNQQTVMAECLIQYDEKYASLRNSDDERKQ